MSLVRSKSLGVMATAWLVMAGCPHAEGVDFAREVLPILSDKCFVCHGPDTNDEDFLRLDSFEHATRDLGGYHAIDSKTPSDSELLARIHSEDDPMPPEDAEKQLSERERDVLTQWVKEGGKYSKHWAFVRPVKPRQRSIDELVKQALAEDNLSLAPEADRADLARRVSLVLTGLPPEPEQLRRYLANPKSGYERLVEELLASRRFGEHQARYWLDAVRYGDTHGLHLDNRRGIYPYRDWVVRAFNKNLPLDKFILWQLAGDLLPNPSLEQQVATGFVRLNPSTAEGGAIAAEFQAKNNFDRTETLGTVLLGMSLTCARCHNHKYDPVSQAEYYQLLAFFNSTAESALDGNSYTYGPTVKTPTDQGAWDAWETLDARRREVLRQVETRMEQLELSADEKKQWKTASESERLAMVADGAGSFAECDVHPAAMELNQQLLALREGFTTSLVARELDEARETRVLRRGEYNLPVGDPLEPDVIQVMGAFPRDAPRNRLGLAQWLTADEHPLVARVVINRVWQSVFGHGLVRTPEDFGVQGQQPTHPELLDWLAVELQQSGWDLKHMIRLMVTSETFRQSSAWREATRDPDNRLWARGPGYRMDAEVIRDMALWCSGLLDPHMGGEGVKPYQPPGMWLAMAHPASNTKKYERDQGQRLYRRSLYVYWKRTSPHPMMTLFDAPDRESSCVRRSRTNTPLQSLALLNETQRVEMGRSLAQRLLLEHADDASRLDFVFGRLACRKPSTQERNACMTLLRQMRGRYQQAREDAERLMAVGEIGRDSTLDVSEHAAWTQLAITLLASDIALLLF